MSVPLTPEQEENLDTLICSGDKIGAIKFHRAITNGELLLSKQFVEARERELRLSRPGRFRAKSRSPMSCVGLMLILLLPLIVAAICMYFSKR